MDTNDKGAKMDALQKVILAMAITFIALIGIIVVVGLVQKTLDPTGAATVLVGAFTGLMTGFFLKLKGDSSDK